MAVPALEVRELTRRFGARVAVNQLDLTVEQGDIYGFLGPNGAGKTTAMRCCLGLIRRTHGRVRIFGETNISLAKRHVGAIIEVPAFHGWMTGRSNLFQSSDYLGWSRKKAAGEIDRVLERVGLAERGSDKAGTYSLGMKQRLGIARALLGGPKLLMLDEPTNGLDPRGMREVRELIRSLALHDKITVFVSSHLLAEVQSVCNRVGIIQQGTLRAEGTVEELLDDSSLPTEVEVGADDVDSLRQALVSITSVEVLGAGERGRIRVRCQPDGIGALNDTLHSAGVSVSALVPIQRSLEDVFLEVTR